MIPGGWPGWSDFVAGEPVTDPNFTPEGMTKPKYIMADFVVVTGNANGAISLQIESFVESK